VDSIIVIFPSYKVIPKPHALLFTCVPLPKSSVIQWKEKINLLRHRLGANCTTKNQQATIIIPGPLPTNQGSAKVFAHLHPCNTSNLLAQGSWTQSRQTPNQTNCPVRHSNSQNLST